MWQNVLQDFTFSWQKRPQNKAMGTAVFQVFFVYWKSIWTMPFEWSDLVESDVMDAFGVSLFSQNHNYIEKLKLG